MGGGRWTIAGAAVPILAVGALWAWRLAGRGDGLPEPVRDPAGPAYALGVDVPFADLQLPKGSRDGAPVPDALPLDGWTADGGGRWSIPVPFRPRGIFFFRAQPGMALLTADGREVPFRMRGDGRGLSWSHDRDRLTVVTADGGPPPPLRFQYPPASERERALNLDEALAAGLAASPEDFARGAMVQEGWTSRTGLLLPAPAQAAFRITLPQAAVLTFEPGLVRPELGAAGQGDGARLVVTVDDGSGPVQVLRRHLAPGDFTLQRVDLSRWQGREVLLTFATEPGATATFDYAFLGGPVVASHKANPRRVVLVFVDTLRPDRLSTYGYARPTSPQLDGFAEGAVVFEQARSIAPWTLPSARTLVTGRQPEHYDGAPTLPGLLGAQGFATAMFAGNVYLSANFDMTRDWQLHEVGRFDGGRWVPPPAEEVTARALDWLDAHRGQDALVLLHYMNAHLPYDEPAPQRDRWAGPAPEGFPVDFTLRDVRQHSADPEVRTYVSDRYDQSVRWIDSALGPLLDGMGPDDVFVLFSDHGEEFWEHGGFEHGHTLHDELLRVPLIVRAPGLDPARVDAPVSLLDVAPTVLDALGIPAPPMDGRSLLPVARGEPGAAEALRARVQAFGRPLYGAAEQWGVLDGATKWTTSRGRESLYDLARDPGERSDLARVLPDALPPLRDRLGQVLGQPAGVGFRIHPRQGAARAEPLTVSLHVPGGIQRAWRGEDPLQRTELEVLDSSPDAVSFQWSGPGTREAFVLPALPAGEVVHRLCMTVTQGGSTRTLAVPSQVPTGPGPTRVDLINASVPGGSVALGWSMSPAPPLDGRELDATDDEMTEALKAVGYLSDDEPIPLPQGTVENLGSPCDIAPSPPAGAPR